MMKNRFIKLVFSISIFFFNFNVKSQNLVPNSSFEEYILCPSLDNQEIIPGPWLGPPTNSVEYYNSCSDYRGVPSQDEWHYQSAHSGNAYVGIFTLNFFGANYREYIQVQMLEILEQDNCYFVEFFINPLNDIKFATNNTALHFSSTAISTTNTAEVLNLEAHIQKTGNPIISDTLNWTRIAGIYLANGNEQYITIGNFKNDINTDTLVKLNYQGVYPGAYYLIDDVSVIAVSDLPNQMPAFAGNDTIVAPGDSIFIGQEISNLNCTWRTLDGTFIADSISGIYVQPSETTTYVVEQNLCGTITYDTVTIFVNPVGLSEPLAEALEASGIVIYPNPNNGNFEIQNPTKQVLTFELKNALGQVVYTEKIEHEKHFMNLSLSKGVYFATFENASGGFEQKVVIK
jgi:hypothetical protein